jgi:hypothetical protein
LAALRRWVPHCRFITIATTTVTAPATAAAAVADAVAEVAAGGGWGLVVGQLNGAGFGSVFRGGGNLYQLYAVWLATLWRGG